MAALIFGCTNLNEKKIGDNDFRSAKINQPKEYVNVAILIFPLFEHFQAYVFYVFAGLFKFAKLVHRRVIFWLNGFGGLTNMKVREGNLYITQF